MAALPSLSDKHRKLVRSLHRRRHRDEEKLFVAEGATLVQQLLHSHVEISFVVVQHNMLEPYAHILEQLHRHSVEAFATSTRVFSQISETTTPQGILAVAHYFGYAQEADGNVVVLDGVQDPGNVGTIIRCAHFFGYPNVVLGSGCVDRFNSKLVRSTMGSMFHVAVLEVEVESYLRQLRQTHTLIGASAHAVTVLEELSPRFPICIVIGSEGSGISESVRSHLHSEFRIRGSDQLESLNASVAAGICLHHFSSHPSP